MNAVNETIARALFHPTVRNERIALARVEAFRAVLAQYGYHVVPMGLDHPDHPDKQKRRDRPLDRFGVPMGDPE